MEMESGETVTWTQLVDVVFKMRFPTALEGSAKYAWAKRIEGNPSLEITALEAVGKISQRRKKR